jgi:uncharacterized membrane protein YeaQ/YmgE (transglycosylase-associated protein family)
VDWPWFLLISLAAGWLAALLVRGTGFGLIGDTLLGVIGGLIGNWLFGVLGLHAAAGKLGSFIAATAGAAALLAVLRLIKRA